VGRANRSTTSALGTGIEIEQVFPRVVNDPVDPKALTLLKVNLFQPRPERLETGGVNVQRRCNGVHHLGVRRPGDEREHAHQMKPPKTGMDRSHLRAGQ
jgi:hypothetical protein